MLDFKAFDGGEPFLKPEEKIVYWYETEDELISDKSNFEREHNLHLVDAIEIGDCRDVVFEQ